MHENNKGRNPHAPMKQAEIVLRFDVPEAEATQEWMDAVVGIIKRDIVAELGNTAEVEGKWL